MMGMTARRSLVLLGVGALIGALVIYVVVRWGTESTHPGGDPNGTVFKRMEAIEHAVPSGATIIHTRTSEAQWVPGCAEISDSHSGWSKASVYVTFSDSDPQATVDIQIDRSLRSSGWSYAPMRITKGQGLVPHWVISSLSEDRPIDAFAFVTPEGSNSWLLSASWQPPGPIGQGCP